MIKIGFNVLAWTADVSDKVLPTVDRLKKIGYDGVECFIGSPDANAYRRFGDHAHALGLETTAVTVMDKDTNPADPSATVRAKALDRIKWAIDRTHGMHSKVLCGPFHSAHANFSRNAPQEQEYQWSAEVLHTAGEYAAQANITLALEALNRFECYLCNTMNQLKYLVLTADHPRVKAMYDTHHSNIEEKKIATALDTIAPVLHHVHISENDRGTPGSGHVLWDETYSALAKINYEGWLTIEAFSRNDPDFANAINVWREYDKPWDIAEKGYAFIKQMCQVHGLK
ncbi:sugar phosphate isomerase/epimerase family protein [Chryseolinea sp. H1M3-3]|uniref:sugar phosphate isomerase/epimerase family protein n=1 Tax=Chryseolinea sp. H1M3-3 TaxID=3034144 RepID=UPI0023EDBCEF|nr:sugar phosphate isomerase/epimerase family protein [Chryseolinea sp. H1M3-3]